MRAAMVRLSSNIAQIVTAARKLRRRACTGPLFPNVLGGADDRLHEFARRFDPNRSRQLDPNNLRWLARQNGQIVSGTPEESSACRSRARDPNACRVAWRAPAGDLDRGPPAQRALGGRRTWDAEKRADVLLDD